jgi:nitrate/nitrite transport system permease protein
MADERTTLRPFSLRSKRDTALATVALAVMIVFVWWAATRKAAFDPGGLSEDDLLAKEFTGEIVKDASGRYVYNPDKTRGMPGPEGVARKFVDEFSDPFHKRGANDHGVGHLICYTVLRFGAGFLAASVVAILFGVIVGMSSVLYRVFNPFIQILKPISPLAWMPLLLYTVQNPRWTAILVVFMASLWPTIANTAFGVSNIRKEYMQVSSLLELGWAERLIKVVLPAAAPAIVAGLRISFGSALVAVVPAEMLLGELGIGYLSWIEWNNLDIAGVIFAIVTVGLVGVLLDSGFTRLARLVSYAD